jgi:hypothetical protein
MPLEGFNSRTTVFQLSNTVRVSEREGILVMPPPSPNGIMMNRSGKLRSVVRERDDKGTRFTQEAEVGILQVPVIYLKIIFKSQNRQGWRVKTGL